jgi:hypothetical protein
MEAILFWIWLMVSNPPEFRARMAGMGVTAASTPNPIVRTVEKQQPPPRPCRPC